MSNGYKQIWLSCRDEHDKAAGANEKEKRHTKHPLIRNVPYRKVVASINFLYERALGTASQAEAEAEAPVPVDHTQNDMSASAASGNQHHKYKRMHLDARNLKVRF